MRRIAAKYLYTLTSPEPVVNGFVELEDDGTVIRTGVCADPAAEPVFYDGAVAPGFVNAHCHVELSYMKGLFRKGTGMAGFIDQINELRDTKSLEEKVRDLSEAMDSLWEQGVDYRCGTGHGVGYMLAVHEAPPNIRWGHTDAGSELAPLKPGMVCSDEPGVYFEGKYGIRCENMILCVKDEANEYGQFLRFETLTMVPFDLNLIDKQYLDEKTINLINDYHEKVYQTLLPYLNDEEAQFLRRKTVKL